jgi:cytidylate kinase
LEVSVPAIVTIAALHGSGGSAIGPRVAERLGVEFLDRAIPSAVARRAGLTEQAVDAVGARSQHRTDRWRSALARTSTAINPSADVERIDLEEARIRAEIESFLASASESGGVVVGRGGAVVLASVPAALHVYLGGPLEARVARTMELESIDRAAAERQVAAADRARRDYVRGAYGVDGDDPGLYHVMLDSTALGIDACVDLIVSASQARTRSHSDTAER